uniref:Uncharacterized protein n=1 Tax=Anguilla anguilla TaxID=7936 RepID=A0A0E9QX07_ANGAN
MNLGKLQQGNIKNEYAFACTNAYSCL